MFGACSRVVKQMKVKDFQVFDFVMFSVSWLTTSNHVINFIFVLERFLIILFDYVISNLQAFRENLFVNLFTFGIQSHRNWHAPTHRKCSYSIRV